MTTAAIIQARLSSRRLPGKVMASIGQQTVLGHVIDRCLSIQNVDEVVCATVVGAEGDPIEEVAALKGVRIHRGPLNDVLERYRGAAVSAEADVVLRVTSDCPLLDPAICADVINLRHQHGADLACNNDPPSFPYGLDCEAFTTQWLERAAAEAISPIDREHVSPYIRRHPAVRRVNLLSGHENLTGYRWALDYPEDLLFIRRLFQLLPDRTNYDWHVPLGIVEGHPELLELNARNTDQRTSPC